MSWQTKPTNPRPLVNNILPGHFGAPGTMTLSNKHGGYDTATNLGNGNILFVGGGSFGNRAEVYVASGSQSGNFIGTGSLLVARRNSLAALLPNGKVLIVGGGPVSGCVSTWNDEVEVYNPGTSPANGHFVSLDTLNPNTNAYDLSPLAHAPDLAFGGYSNLTTLADGRILLWGAQSCNDDQTICTPISEIYDSSQGPNGTFTATQATIPFGQGSTATPLPNGKVLFAGGGIPTITNTLPSNIAGLYNPSNDTFVSTGSLTTPRDGATAVLLSNNTVLISGGTDDAGNVLANAEIYGISAGTFQANGPQMTVGRLGQTATLLSDGQHVLIVGGLTAFGDNNNPAVYSASAELYNVDTHTFTATGSMTVIRSNFTSTLLVGGTVLVVGSNFNQLNTVPSADLYLP